MGTIVHVTDCYAGGVKRHVDDVRAGLGLDGVRHVLVGLGDLGKGADHHWGYSRKAVWRIPVVLLRLRRLLRELSKDGPVVVHGQSTVGYWFAGLAARLRMVPRSRILATPHGHHALMAPSGAAHRAYTAIDRWLVPRRATWVAVSPDERHVVESCHPWRYDVRTLRNGIAPLPPPAKRDRPLDVVLVGRLSAQKNLEYALDVARNLPDARVVFVGDGPLGPQLRRQAAGLAHVEFAGFVPSPDPYYAQAKVMLSTSHYEAGITYAMMEALALGCRVASTPTRGVESGLDAIQAIRLPGDDPAEAARLLKQGLERPRSPGLPEEFTLERMLEGYRALYREKLGP